MKRIIPFGILIGIIFGLSSGQTALESQNDRKPSLVGTSWEIMYPLHPEKGVFVRSFTVWNARDYSDPYNYCSMPWWSQDRWFEITLNRNAGKDRSTIISGMYEQDRMEGIDRIGQRISTWNGHKVDGDPYEYFLDPTREEIIIIQMLGYRIDDDYFRYSRDRIAREPKNENEIRGRVFDVLSPEPYRGMLYFTHYDGPYQGYPSRMSQLEQRFVQKVYKQRKLGDLLFRCDYDLDLHTTESQTIDEATLEMQQKLHDENIQQRYMAAHRLVNFNTALSRQVLMEAYWTHPDRGTKGRIVYVLSKYPGADAEGVFLDVLEGDDSWAQWHAIQALVKIQSVEAIPSMQGLQEKTRNWLLYYSCVQGLRNLEGWELPKDLQDALYTLRFDRNFKTEQRNTGPATELIINNLDIAAPDVMDIYLETNLPDVQTEHHSNSMNILSQLGQGLSDLIRRCLMDEDPYIRVKGMLLAKAILREKEFIDVRKSVKEDATYAWYYTHYGRYRKE